MPSATTYNCSSSSVLSNKHDPNVSRDATEAVAAVCMQTAQHHMCLACAGQSDVVDEEGQANPVISWSDLHVLYQLPDGSKWAEHGNFYDCEDLVSIQSATPILFTGFVVYFVAPCTHHNMHFFVLMVICVFCLFQKLKSPLRQL